MPEFINISGGFMITIFASKNISDTLNDPINDPINDRQKTILKAISRNKYITREELAEISKVSVEPIKRDIQKLKQLKLIKRIGPAKGGYWKVMK